MQVQHIPLSQLRRSPSLNVRKHGGANVADLIASIPAHSLLHPLVVTPSKTGFDVVDGGRRLTAIEQLVKDGAWNGDVPCHVVTAEEAYEASLAGNTVREQMHPADEFDAFAALAKNFTAGEIGARYGKTEKYVAQRLRLGLIAPQLLDEYRAGRANLEQMMALAIVDDHKAQLEAWKRGEHDNWMRHPDRLRTMLLAKDVALDSPIGKFVGVEAYKAAGGEVREDLFSDVKTLPDGKLVDKVAQAKLDEAAKKLKAAGWGWVLARRQFGYDEKHKYRANPNAKPDAKFGAVVTIGNDGKVEVIGGLTKPGETPAKTAKKAAAKSKPKPGASSREQSDKLYGVRTAILRTALREKPYYALAALAAAMATNVFTGKWTDPSPTLIVMDAQPYVMASIAQSIKATDPEGVKLQASWAAKVAAGAKKHGSVLAWLIAEDEAVAVDLLAFMTTELLLADDTDEQDVHKFAALVDVSFASSWAPTVDWLGQQTAPYVIGAVVEACGKDVAKPLEKLKGKAIATAAHPLLMKAGWMPELLRSPTPPKPATKKAPAKKAAKK